MQRVNERVPEAPMVEFRRVTKTYDGQVLAVADLDLSIAKGEFVTFLGPSGSGKTTSLMMLAGFEDPTAGDILLAGRSVRRIPPHRRNIGMVFQSYTLFPHMSVAENVAFPLSVRGVARTAMAERVAKALSQVRLSGFEDRRPAALSGGQQQRVALARALVFDPDLVLMDEPLGALDKQLREQLQLEIKHLHAVLGVTVVYVTHDQSEALTLSNRIVVFNGGRAQQVGTPSEIYEAPESSFVAQFIGENNRIDGRIAAIDGAYCLVDTPAGRIRARAVNVSGVGTPTSLSVRPERIRLADQGPAPDNSVEARVIERIYHGEHDQVRFALPGGVEFTLRIAGERALEPGSGAMLTWAADHCRALDAVSPAATASSSQPSQKSVSHQEGVPA